MKKLIFFAVAILAVAFVSEARESGNFYIDSYVKTLNDNGAVADYDGQDVVMTINDPDTSAEESIRNVGPEVFGNILKEQIAASFKTMDAASSELLSELAKAGCGIRVHYVCGAQVVDARISPQEISSAL